jgi:outer membrane protein TolC
MIAQRQVEISHQAFRARVADIILKASFLYWELIFQRENLLVQQDSLKLAQQILEINATKVKLGLMAPIEILVAESLVASREEAVIVAQKGILDTEDQLGVLIGQGEIGLPFSGKIVPSDRPVSEAASLDSKQLLSLAYQDRPEIAAKALERQNDEMRMRVAENRLKSSLDFIFALGPTGTGQTFSDSFDQLTSGDFYRWEAGFSFSVPIGNRLAIAAVWKESASQRRSKIETERLKLQIQLDVREGERRVETDFERIKATGRALALAKRQLLAGTERFQLGLLSSRDLITFQNDVTIAEGHALRAVIDYNKSLGNLDRVTGVLLKKYQIEIGLP